MTSIFDLRSTIPVEVQEKYQTELNELGMSNVYAEKKSHFRDPRTCQALQETGESVRQLFFDAGFGLIPSGVRLPEGRFLAIEEQDRIAAIGKVWLKFQANREQLLAAERGDFRIKDFFLKSTEAHPFGNSELEQTLLDLERKAQTINQTYSSLSHASPRRSFAQAIKKFVARVLFVAGFVMLVRVAYTLYLQ